MKGKLFATAAAVLAATIGLVALLCLMVQGNPPDLHRARAAPPYAEKDATTSCLNGTFSMSRSSGAGPGLPSASRQISAVSSRSDRPGSCSAQSGRG
jgi:hypothetical protein